MNFLEEVIRLQNAKNDFYNLIVANGVDIDKSVKIDEYPAILLQLIQEKHRENVEYGFINDDNKYQQLDLNQESLKYIGQPIDVQTVFFKISDDNLQNNQ